ncbi:pectinesterase-like [Nymphaea colorata]|nr:pectinesterase-like [Nymphaea colorata]
MSGYGHLDPEKKGSGTAARKIMATAIFGIAIVAVVIAVAFVEVRKNPARVMGQPPQDEDSLSPKMELITTICAPTDYKDTCTSFLSNAVNETAKPKDAIEAAVKVTIDEVTKALNVSHNLAASGNRTYDGMTRQALEDCKELLQFATHELHYTFSDVSQNELKDLPKRTADLRNWLSAVISYQVTCVDGLNDTNAKTAMQKALKASSELTSNALAIITELSTIFSAFPIELKHDRLLTEAETNEELRKEGYPEWLSAEDRRLLGELRRTNRPRPHAVVAKDGSGKFTTITAALEAMPKTYMGRYVIYVKAGIYDEHVIVDEQKVNVFMYGDGPRKTIVTGRKNNVDGVPTYGTASFTAIADGFMAHAMGFRNTAGAAKHQAVALRIQSDHAVLYNCRMDGYQDTLYAQTHRQLYRNCVISGTVDFIFGNSAAVFQNCLIVVRRPLNGQENTITAHGRTDKREGTSFVIQNCRIVPDARLYPVRFQIRSYLGRPWKEYASTVVMESTIGDLIQPAGWLPWDGDFALKTLYYAEYNNRGPGAQTSQRVKWPGFHVLTSRKEVLQYTIGPFLDGTKWLPGAGIPYHDGLFH